MIHIAIYDRNPAVGLELGDLSQGFPQEYRDEIQQISEAFGTPEDSGIPQMDALRYTPLGDKYLLSLVQRMNAGRRYNRIVHYLMDRRDAEFMLQWDLRALKGRLAEVAGSTAQVQQSILHGNGWPGELKEIGTLQLNAPVRHVLFTAAALPDSTKKVRLVLPEGDELSLQLTGWLLSQLPPALRILIRFNSSVSIPQEGNGCCLLFCTPEANRLFERGVTGGELADVCVFSLGDGCDQSLLQREFDFVLPAVEASEDTRKKALALFGEDGDWEKYLALLSIPYQSLREELREIAALCGSDTAAQQLDQLGYPPRQLETLARNAPGWLRNDPALYRAVMNYRKAPDPAARADFLDAAHIQPTLPQDFEEPEPAKPRRPAHSGMRPGTAIAVLLLALVILLFLAAAMLVIGASPYQYLLPSAALALCCTALGAALVLLVQQLYRILHPRRRRKRR